MSKVRALPVSCPSCGHAWDVRLFDSLNGDRIPAQVEDILAGTFEQQTCPSCAAAFRPEHTMLYAEFSTRTWIVMHPPADRARYARIERGVELVIERNFQAAAPMVAEGVRGVRPRLVFGQLMLTEALRAQRAGLPPPLLECAKLLELRRNLGELMRHGPSQLVFEGFDDAGGLRCGIHNLDNDRRLGERTLPANAVAEARTSQDAFVRTYPALFTQPYVSACRYLYDET
jgi:hypothetical protein